MELWLVYEEDFLTDQSNLVKIFRKGDNAEKFVREMYKKYKTCYVKHVHTND